MKRLRAEKRTPEAEKALLENFLSLAENAGGKTYFIYRSFGSEADTMPLINAVLQLGGIVTSPRVEGTDMVAVKYESGAPIKKNGYGIEEPLGQAYGGEIDVVVLPLLAADEKGNRLGYGGGYYDRFLKGRRCLKIGYAFDFQIFKEPFPFAEDHDVRLDILVTDRRILRIKGKK